MSQRLTTGARRIRWPSALSAFVVVVGFLLGAQLGLALVADIGVDWDSALARSLYHAVVAFAAGMLILRAVRGPDGRLGWGLIGVALAAWIASDLAAEAGAAAPIPGIFRVAFYGGALTGLLVLARGQPVKAAARLDGAIIMLGLLTVWSWLVLDHAITRAVAGEGELIAALAYPLFDLTLGLVLVAVFLRHGWPRSGPWLLIGFAFALTVIADTIAAVETGGELPSGTDPMLDAAWAAGALLLGIAALTAPEPRAAPDDRVGREFSFGLAVAFIAFAALVLVAGRFDPVAIPTIVLALLTLVLGLARTVSMYFRRVRTEEQLAAPSLSQVQALARAVDDREAETRGRSDRIGRYAAAIAVRLGLDVDRVERVILAAKLHDVGMAELPDESLPEPGEPIPVEGDGVHRHPIEGERIVAAAGFSDAAKWIRHHHERWDGTGYPDGLSAGQIPLESRILAIAAMLEAITRAGSDRIPISADAAALEVRDAAGGRFDPGIVRVLVDLLRRHALHVEHGDAAHLASDPPREASKDLGLAEYLRVEAMLSDEAPPSQPAAPAPEPRATATRN